MATSESNLAVAQLAISTGVPSFVEPLHVGRPNIGSEEVLFRRIHEIIDRRWFTNLGPVVQEFEQALKLTLGVRHCIPICNATVALEIAIRAAELKGEVIVPSFTFVATAHALQWQEITPVFCDIKPGTHSIDPEQVERLINPRTSGIIGVHTWGKPCDTDSLQALASRYRLTLMYDAAHAFGCSSKGLPIGNFGLCEVFSFHATKFFNSFEGGAIATNNDELARKIRLMKNFGFSGEDCVTFLGTNGKMTEISAAMGLTGLESLHEIIEANRRNYWLYRSELAHLPGIRMVLYNEEESNNFQYIVLEIDEQAAGISRNTLLKILRAENVLSRRYFYPGCHRMEPYRSLFPHAGLALKNTEELCEKVMVLPTGSSISPAYIKTVCRIVKTALDYPDQCRSILEAKSLSAAHQL